MERVTVVPTGGHPIVYAECCHTPGRPTVLIYGHYDVQPAEPLDEWQSPPFEPMVRGNDLYGRGASDDKGQLFAHMKALEAFLQTGGELPVNVKCLFEGEEEIGSPNLTAFLRRDRHALAADVAVLSDMPCWRQIGRPSPNRCGGRLVSNWKSAPLTGTSIPVSMAESSTTRCRSFAKSLPRYTIELGG